MIDDILIPEWNIRCVSKLTYGYTKRDAGYRLPALKGRPRYRRKDSWASYIVTLQFDFTKEQYQEFQDFWYNDIEAGSGWFLIPLTLDDPEFYNQGNEVYAVHATGGYSSTYGSHDTIVVAFEVELAGGFRTNIFDCPIIYGGPITNPAPDTIYGGPITALAEDVITPCPGVDPNG